MSQTRLQSLIEAGFNTMIGFGINYVANLLIFPLFGMHISLTDNILMGLIYTVVSVVRSYVVRRYFNARLHRAAVALSGQREADPMSEQIGALEEDLAVIVAQQMGVIDRLKAELQQKDEQVEMLSLDLAIYRGKVA